MLDARATGVGVAKYMYGDDVHHRLAMSLWR